VSERLSVETACAQREPVTSPCAVCLFLDSSGYPLGCHGAIWHLSRKFSGHHKNTHRYF
jgi:hypothetical protein